MTKKGETLVYPCIFTTPKHERSGSMTAQDADELFLKEEGLHNSLTVSQLIGILKHYPEDMRVMITWESTVQEFLENNIKEKYVKKTNPEDI